VTTFIFQIGASHKKKKNVVNFKYFSVCEEKKSYIKLGFTYGNNLTRVSIAPEFP
jgi:hypothetical protein